MLCLATKKKEKKFKCCVGKEKCLYNRTYEHLKTKCEEKDYF